MKHGRRLSKKQKLLLTNKQLNYNNWLLERDTSEKIVFVSKSDSRKIEIYKEV